MKVDRRKLFGAYYTPDDVVRSLVRWVVTSSSDRLLDPACGDGRFLMAHANSVGIESDWFAASSADGCTHHADFFTWVGQSNERFDCAAGNPPFIRYQRFNGRARKAAIAHCAKHGARFSSLSSSWAPFVVAAATMLKPGGRMAFVVPAELGHATYARTVIRYLLGHFDLVQVIAIRDKIFPHLSEDCWLLYCEGYGGQTESIVFSVLDRFAWMEHPPRRGVRVTQRQWEQFNCRLRPFVLPSRVLDVYESLRDSPGSKPLGALAKVGIGYVSGANEFFHLRPSLAAAMDIPRRFLTPSVRNGRTLRNSAITAKTVEGWEQNDEPAFLLRIRRSDVLPAGVQRYLESGDGATARQTYKCRNRKPWYVVPDVHVPDAFLSYMSGTTPSLVRNDAGCVATNSVHVVMLKADVSIRSMQQMWKQPLTELSCEIEGHPLGGGMLKLEPREAARVVLSKTPGADAEHADAIQEGIDAMRRWRHYG